METDLTIHTQFEVDFLEACDAESIIAELQRVAAKLGQDYFKRDGYR